MATNHFSKMIVRQKKGFEVLIHFPVSAWNVYGSNFNTDFLSKLLSYVSVAVATNVVAFTQVPGKFGDYEYKNALSHVIAKYDKQNNQFIFELNGIVDLSKESIEFMLANYITSALTRDLSQFENPETWMQAMPMKPDIQKGDDKVDYEGVSLNKKNGEAFSNTTYTFKANVGMRNDEFKKNEIRFEQHDDSKLIKGASSLLIMLSQESVYKVNNLVNELEDMEYYQDSTRLDYLIGRKGTRIENSCNAFEQQDLPEVCLDRLRVLINEFRKEIPYRGTIPPKAYQSAEALVDYFVANFEKIKFGYSLSESAIITNLLAYIVKTIRNLYNLDSIDRENVCFNLVECPEYLHHENFRKVVLTLFEFFNREKRSYDYIKGDINIADAIQYFTNTGNRQTARYSIRPCIGLEALIKLSNYFLSETTTLDIMRLKLTDCLTGSKWQDLIKYCRLYRALNDYPGLLERITNKHGDIEFVDHIDVIASILLDTVNDNGEFLAISQEYEGKPLLLSHCAQELKTYYETFKGVSNLIMLLIESNYGEETFQAWGGCNFSRRMDNHEYSISAVGRQIQPNKEMRAHRMAFAYDVLVQVTSDRVSNVFTMPTLLPSGIDLGSLSNVIKDNEENECKFKSNFANINGDYSDLLEKAYRLQWFYTSVLTNDLHFYLRANVSRCLNTIIPNGVGDSNLTFSKGENQEIRQSVNQDFIHQPIYVEKKTIQQDRTESNCYSKFYTLTRNAGRISAADVLDLLFAQRIVGYSNNAELKDKYFSRFNYLWQPLTEWYSIRDLNGKDISRSQYSFIEPGSSGKMLDPILFSVLAHSVYPTEYSMAVQVPSAFASYVEESGNDRTSKSFPPKPKNKMKLGVNGDNIISGDVALSGVSREQLLTYVYSDQEDGENDE